MNDDVPPGGSTSAPERPTFDAVYREGAAYVFDTLRCLGVAKQDCEDAMHEVFLIVERRLPEYEPRGRLKAWLAAIARHVAWQYRRRRARAPALVGSSREAEQELTATMRDHDQDDAETGAMMREVFFRVLDELEDNRRIVFVMHEVQGIPIAEVALALDIPEGTAWTRLRLARADFEAVCKRLAARERGNAVLFGMLAPAALLEVGRTMPPLPAGVYDRVLARLRSAPGSPSPGGGPRGDAPARVAKRAASTSLSGLAIAIGGGLVLAVGIAIGAVWSPLQRSHPEPQPPPPSAVAPGPEDAPSAASIATAPASAAVPQAARSGAAGDAQDDEATERLLMAKAAEALHTGDAALALAAVEEHARRFRGGGRLAETRDFYWIVALRRTGRTGEANARVERFAQTYPKSAHLDALRAADGGAGPP